MACTVAVETVISEHYEDQIHQLGADQSALKETITTFRAEELEHHDIGLAEGAEKAPLYGLISGAIRAGCRGAIWVAKRV